MGPVLRFVRRFSGSLLDPVLPDVVLSLFTDDTVYHYSSMNLGLASLVLQRQLD